MAPPGPQVSNPCTSTRHEDPVKLFSLLMLAVPADGGVTPMPPVRWGASGHEMVGRAAAMALPEQMPAFFRQAADQLAYLNLEPDRWRSREERQMDPAMDAAHSPEHYIDLELVPGNALAAPDRLAFGDSLRAHGVEVAKTGLVSFRILELTQRLRVGFREWRAATDPREKAWIEARIVNDAGILGHYVADASNPAHTSIHHNGWVGANPKGYATDNRFHGRFESEYVGARIRLDDVRRATKGSPRVFASVRPAIWQYVQHSHGQLERLYELDKRNPFNARTTAPENKQFATERLAAGAEMLRDLWWTAWVTSSGSAR